MSRPAVRLDPESGALYDTAADAERLIRRPQDPTDNAAPSGWTAAAGALLSYAAQTGASPHRLAAERALGVVKALGPRVPRFIGHGLAVAEAAVSGPLEVAVVGEVLGDLHRTALLGGAPGAVVAAGPEGSGELPLLADRGLIGGLPAAYVCRSFVCDAPTTDPAELASKLS
ncbi:Thioredoxin domain-containing protein OS=Streptomyces alboniger OX=132473 GN=CP975_22305 PE=4 SV=1 [Streptomyces alboniger]